MRPSHSYTAPLFLLTAFLAGCGAGSDAREANALRVPEKVDACELFPFLEAQGYAGTGVAPISSTYDDAMGRDLKQCAYNAGSIEQPQMISLEIRPAKTVREAERRQEASRSFLETLSKGKVQEIQGVGDAALWAGGTVDQLHARKGAVLIVITMQAGKDPLAAAKKAAETTFARLQQAQPPAAKP